MLRRTRPQLPGYAELVCRSHFSFLTGASHPRELVARAQALGYAALALTDECSLSGAVHAHEAATEAGLPLVLGALMQLQPLAPGGGAADLPRGDGARLALLVQNRRGWGNLAQWVSVARRRAAKGRYQALASDLEGRVPTAPHLAGLPGCFALLLPAPGQPFEAVFAQAQWLKTWFGADRCALGVPQLRRAQDAALADVARRVAALTGLAVAAVGDVLMHARSRKPLQDVLTALRHRKRVADAGHALEPNAENHLRSRLRLAELVPADWLDSTLRIAASCTFSLAELRYEYPQEIVPDGHTPTSWLRALAEAGALRRFPGGVPAPVRASLEHELALIAQLKFEPYFLTVADIVAWARGQGILCQGRGSAANSVVCYCLGVTEVDPARTRLLFERFISAERNEPPDIDIDFEHQRREEVIQYLYRKYGRHRAALTAVVIRYRPRSAVRDVGRALGIDADRIAMVARGQHWFDGKRISDDRLREAGLDPASPTCRLWVELTQQLIGFPRHLSQHPGGFVIARDDVSRLVPVENAAMDGRTVIQWDKDDLDALGLIKVDILALGMLSAIRRALEFVGQKMAWAAAPHPAPGRPKPGGTPSGGRARTSAPACAGTDAWRAGRACEPGRGGAAGAGGLTFTMQMVPAEDPVVYEMLCRGDSLGTFQVESRAQMSMLPRLQPRCFYDLVIEVAIVRPGPIQGGMVHPYLRRRRGEEPVVYPSDEVRQALGRTLGVPIFQEQVMQLAMLAADFTPGEADRLRRAMAAWKRKGGLGPFHERLVGRMVEKGYESAFAEALFKQMEGFGEYGFPESHAASFALLVYVSAWLKCHHPDAFLAALLNSQPMGFYAPAQLVRDAREHGVQVRPVDVLHSQWDSVLELDALDAHDAQEGHDAHGERAARAGPPALRPVRLGFSRLAGLPEDAARRLLAARSERAFDSVEDLARRAALDAHALNLLAAGDALRGLAGHRHQAAWHSAGVDTRASALLRASRTHEAPAALPAPSLGSELVADYRASGLSLKAHPLSLLRRALAGYKVQPAAVLQGFRPGQLARASGLVTHRQRPETAKGVVFVTLEDETGAVNVIVWPAVARAQRQALLGAQLLTVYGVWQSDQGVQHLIARTLVDHTPLLQGLTTRSRDFH